MPDVLPNERKARVLVVADQAAATPALLSAIRDRAERGPAQFRLIVPNPAAAELHILHPERHEKADEAERVLRDALPQVEAAAAGHVIGSVSVRHDPMDAIEDVLYSEPIDEIFLCLAPRGFSRLIHQDLAHRLHHYGLPITTIKEQVTSEH